MRNLISRINITLRGIMELAIVVGLAFWGYTAAQTTLSRIALAVGAPGLVFGFWGFVDFRQAGRFAEPFRLLQELALSFLAAAAVYSAGQPTPAWGLASVSIIHHALVYALGERLLKH